MTIIAMENNLGGLEAADPWRYNHLGHWLRSALHRLDARTLELMAQHPAVPLNLANLARRSQVGAAHLYITRHLPVSGCRLTVLAQRAGITKQAMSTLVNECEAWGLVTRGPDSADARARKIAFTPQGLAWLLAYQECAIQAEAELRATIGDEITTVVSLGLEAYGAA